MRVQHRQSQNPYWNALPLFVPQVEMFLSWLSVAQRKREGTIARRAQSTTLRTAVHQQVVGTATPHNFLSVVARDALGGFVPVQNRSLWIDYIEPERKFIREATQDRGIVEGGSHGVPLLFSRQNEAGTSTLSRFRVPHHADGNYRARGSLRLGPDD